MRRDLLLLGQMIDAAERAHELVTGLSAGDLQADRLRSESLLWNFTVLGEAAAQLSAEAKNRFPDIPWQQPARLRNRIVHGYWSIDIEIIHTTATEQLPAFARDIRDALDTLTGEQASQDHDPETASPPGATAQSSPAAEPARDAADAER
jgi:uncharacterized protein with HEPN domain